MSILETLAFLTSLIAVSLGVLGPRITWPWWSLSSLLYSILFFQSGYYASAALQFVFIAGALWGWLGWGPKGAKPKKVTTKLRLGLIAVVAILSITLWPILTNIGAVSSEIESLVLYAGIHRKVGGFLRLLAYKFPFAVYYDIVGDSVRVWAVIDCRRKPEWIKQTLSERRTRR